MKITVVKDYRGQEEVHAAGCADLKRRNRPYRLAEALTMDAETLGDMYSVYWECIADESVGEGDYPTLEAVWWAWRGEFSVKPCASKLPEMPEPGTEKVQDQGSQEVPEQGTVANVGPEVGPESRGEKMNSTELTTHLRETVRGEGPEFHLVEDHGVPKADLPASRQEAAKLHAKLHAAEVPAKDAEAEKVTSLLSGVTVSPEEAAAARKPARKTPAKVAPKTPAAPKASPVKAAAAANKVRSRNAVTAGRKLASVPDLPAEITPPAKAPARTRKATAKVAAPATETAPKTAPRSRKATAKAPAPAAPKPAPRGRNAAAAPAPKAESNGSAPSRSEAKRALARAVVTMVTEAYAGASESEKADIAYWLHWCPTGDLWWPADFPEPTTAGWIAGKARLAEANGK